MKRTAMRRAAAVAAISAMALLGGCSDNSDPQDVTGTWEGPLSLRLTGGTTLDGNLTLVLTQEADFASGALEWTPIGETQSVAGPIDGENVQLRLLFRCSKSVEATVLEGTVDGDTIDIDDASGSACTTGDDPIKVDGATGTFTRTTDGLPG